MLVEFTQLNDGQICSETVLIVTITDKCKRYCYNVEFVNFGL